MHRVNVILHIDQEYLMTDSDPDFDEKIARKQIIKDKDDLFDFALGKGLIKKTEEGYVFVGKLKGYNLSHRGREKIVAFSID